MDNVKNAFTAYLVRALKNTTINYRDKRIYVNDKISPFDPAWMDALADAGSRTEKKPVSWRNRKTSVTQQEKAGNNLLRMSACGCCFNV